MGKPCFGSLDDFFTEDHRRTNPRETRLLSVQRCVKYLDHACRCGNANCRLPSCQKMKRVIQHAKSCKQKNNGGCPVCKQLIALCCYHAKNCQEAQCFVPFCANIKKKILEGDTANMQSPRNSNSSSQPSPGTQPHTSSSGPPVGALQALQQVQASAARQAMPHMFASNYGNENPVVNLAAANTGLMAQNQQIQAQMQNPMSQMSGWENSGYPQNQQPRQNSQPNYMPNSLGDSATEPPYVMPNPGPSIPGMQRPTQAWQQLLQTLRSPASAQQQQQVLAILKANPQLMAAFIKQRTAQQQLQQQQQQQLQQQQQQQQFQQQQEQQFQQQQEQQFQQQQEQQFQQQQEQQFQQQQQQQQFQQQQQQQQFQQQQQQQQFQQQQQQQLQQLYSSPYPPQPDSGVRFSFGPPPDAVQTVQQERAAARQTVPMVDTEYGNSPSSAQQQYQILAIMKDNPQLMADIIKQHSNFSSIENVD